jgi:hypothetical protein
VNLRFGYGRRGRFERGSLAGKTAKVLVFQKASDNGVRGFVHVRSAFLSQGDDNDGH